MAHINAIVHREKIGSLLLVIKQGKDYSFYYQILQDNINYADRNKWQYSSIALKQGRNSVNQLLIELSENN